MPIPSAQIRFTLVALLAALGNPSVVMAQTSPPPVADPRESLPQVPRPSVSAQPAETVVPPQQTLQDRMAQTLTPTRFRVAGVTALPFEQVSGIFAPLAGKTVTVGELVAKAQAVTQLYQTAGYVLSYAVIPAQTFKDGVVDVTVIEGYVNTVTIQGNAGKSEKAIRKIAEELTKVRPLTRAAFERTTGLLSRMNGFGVVATAKPPTTLSGATPLEVSVTRKPLSAAGSVESREDGLRGIVTGSANGLLGFGENLSATVLIPLSDTDDRFYAFNASVPVGTQGLRVGAFASTFDGRPTSNTLPPAGFFEEYTSESDRAGVTVSYPYLLSRVESLDIVGSLYGTRVEEIYTSAINGSIFPVGTITRVGSVELNYAKSTALGLTRLSGAVHKGIDGLGADKVNTTADLDFYKLRLGASQTFRLAPRIGASIAATAQFSPNELTSTERLSFGGRSFGLGYKPGDLAGDKGVGIAGEVNYSVPVAFEYVKTLQPYVAADAAKVYSNSSFPLVRDSISSVAMGVRVSDDRYYSFDVNVAMPTGDVPSDSTERDPRLNAAYSINF